jgi:hypothetical protein
MKSFRLDYWHLGIAEAQIAYEQDRVMFHAIRNNDSDTILSLISKGAYITEKLFDICLKHNHVDLIPLMIDKYDYYIKVSKNTLSNLCMKYSSHRDIILYVLSSCSVSNMFDLFDTLVQASIHNDIDMIDMIVHKYSFACDILYSPFFWGAKSGHIQVVCYIMKICRNIDEIHMSNTLLNVVYDCCNQKDKIYNCAPVIRLLASTKKCTLFHCIEKCYEKQNPFILALLIPYFPHGFFANETTSNTYVILHAFKLRRSVRRIIKAFTIHRRLILARTLYRAMHSLYSPAIVEIIAKHGMI